MPNINPTLNVPQANFLQMEKKFRAFVAGFGSGKTWVGCSSLCNKAWEFPKVPLGYFAPTYPQIRDIFFPTIEEVAFDWGLKTKVYETNKEVDIYYGRQYRTTIICRSMEKPATIVGFKIGHALIDELDVMAKVEMKGNWARISLNSSSPQWLSTKLLCETDGCFKQKSRSTTSNNYQALKSHPHHSERKQKKTYYDSDCSCAVVDYCVGPRGGHYCITSGGNKRYKPRY